MTATKAEHHVGSGKPSRGRRMERRALLGITHPRDLRQYFGGDTLKPSFAPIISWPWPQIHASRILPYMNGQLYTSCPAHSNAQVGLLEIKHGYCGITCFEYINAILRAGAYIEHKNEVPQDRILFQTGKTNIVHTLPPRDTAFINIIWPALNHKFRECTFLSSYDPIISYIYRPWNKSFTSPVLQR